MQNSKRIGKTFVSDYVLIPQKDVNQFANLTDDNQTIHVDEYNSPLGYTIVHGFLILGVLVKMAKTCLPDMDYTYSVSRGLESVKFINPIKTNSYVNSTFTILNEKFVNDKYMVKYNIEIFAKGEQTPSVKAVWSLASWN